MSAQPPLPPKPPLPPRPPHLRMVVNNAGKIVMSPKIVLDPDEIAGKSMAILGTNGSGKSGTARRCAEEHLKNKLPFTIADIENEYATLKELGEVVIAGPAVDYGSIKVDVHLTNSGEFNAMGREAYEKSLTVILLLGDLDDDTRKQYLKAYIDGVFDAANDPKRRHYYRVFLEETQEYCPQTGLAKSDPLRQSIIRFAKRGRKRKLSLALISQRPSNVDKDVLTQAHVFLLHFVTYATDVNVYADQLGVDQAAEKVKAMAPGDAIYIFGRTYVEDHVTKPVTVSPWDDPETFDPKRFKVVTGLTDLQSDVVREGAKDEGMTVVPTAYVRELERKVPELETQVKTLVDHQIVLEDEIKVLKEREPAPVTGDVDKDALMAELRQARAERDVALAHALPVRMMVDLAAQQVKESS